MIGKTAIPRVILLLAVLLPVTIGFAVAQGGTVTRGGTITVTVVGIPRTAYDIWVKGTHDMTGEPGDQPPTILLGQVDVQQDEPDGPYVIGATPISGGGGTILDDVTPSSSVVPATSYYALVTTDIRGYGTVLFRTSAATATDREFHIVAQNPADPNENVEVVFGVPTPSPTQVMVLPLPTTMVTPLLPPPSTSVPATTAIPTTIPVPTRASPIAASPEITLPQTTPVQGIPLSFVIVIAAVGIGLLLASGRRKVK